MAHGAGAWAGIVSFLDVARLVDLERELSDASFAAYNANEVIVGDTLRAAWVRVHEVVEALMIRDRALDPPAPLKWQEEAA